MPVNASEMVNGVEYDLGNGFTIRPWDIDGERVGYFVTGPAAEACRTAYEGRCGGLVPTRAFRPVGDPPGRVRAVWEVVSGDPLTLAPSIECACGGQHSHVQGGRWL